MPQLSIDDARAWLDAMRDEHGGACPLWLLYTVERRGRLGWRPEPVLVPVEALQLSESVPGSPAVFVVGAGAALAPEEAPPAWPGNGEACPWCGEEGCDDSCPGAIFAARQPLMTLDLDPQVLREFGLLTPEDGEDSSHGALVARAADECCARAGDATDGRACDCPCHA